MHLGPGREGARREAGVAAGLRTEGLASGVTGDVWASSPLSPRLVALMVTLLLSATAVVLLARVSGRQLVFDTDLVLFPSDVAVAVLVLLSLRSALAGEGVRRLGLGSRLWLALLVVSALALAAHPSLPGAMAVLRLAGTFAIALTVQWLARGRAEQLAYGGIAVLGVVESGLGLAQVIRGRALGLSRLGELDLYVHFGSRLGPQGTMAHPYILAGLALVTGCVVLTRLPTSTRWRLLLVVAAIAIAPVGMTYSRAGLLGLLAGITVLLVAGLRGHPRAGLAALALVVGAALPAALWSVGWTTRATQSVSSDPSTARVELVRQSLRLLRDHPLLGVGPGNYVGAISHRPDVDPARTGGIYKPVHAVPLLVAAESGMVAGVLAVALLVALGRQAARTSPWALCLFVALLPFQLLDHFLYTFPQGLVLAGLWIGVLDRLATQSSAMRRPSPLPADPPGGAPA